MADSPVRFGIIGCAKIAKKLSRAINLAPDATLYAIASRSIEKAAEFASKNGLSDTVKIYGSYNEIMDDPCVDVAYIPLPTSLHVQWAVLSAQKKKHVLLEKPTALDVSQLDQILEACRLNGVQFMDGSMWLHHPRTAKMKEVLRESELLGHPNFIHSTSTMPATQEFLNNDIRVKPDLDSLSVLGDLGWYCIGAILWVKDYKLPTQVTALPDVTRNSAGVILSCSASFVWDKDDQTTATIHCFFISHTSMDLDINGSKGSLHCNDFIIPYRENSAGFEVTSGARFVDLHIGWNTQPQRVEVGSKLPQEVLMVQEFARLVKAIGKSGFHPDRKWPEISRKTQLVMDAVRKSIDIGCKAVYV